MAKKKIKLSDEAKNLFNQKKYMLDSDSIDNFFDSIKNYDTAGEIVAWLVENNVEPFSYATYIPSNLLKNYPLKTITIPANITRVANGAFENSKLQEIVFEEGVKSLGIRCFAGCKNLKHIELANSINFIGNNAFVDCPKLREILLPDSLTILNAQLFDTDSDINIWATPRTTKTRLECSRNELDWYRKHLFKYEPNKQSQILGDGEEDTDNA